MLLWGLYKLPQSFMEGNLLNVLEVIIRSLKEQMAVVFHIPCLLSRANSELHLKIMLILYSIPRRFCVNACSKNVSVPLEIRFFLMSKFKSFTFHLCLISPSVTFLSQAAESNCATPLVNIRFFFFFLLFSSFSWLIIAY